MPRKVPLYKLEFNKIAVIRFGKNEEVKQTLPTIRVLKRQYPQAKIHFIVKEQYADVLKNVKEIHKIHTIKKAMFALMETHDEVAKEFIDVVFDLQNDFRSAFLYSAFPYAPKVMYRKYMTETFLTKFLEIPLKDPIPPLWKRFLHTLPRQEYEINDADFE